MERIDANLLVLIKDPLLRQTSSKVLFTIVMAVYTFGLGLAISSTLWLLGFWSSSDSPAGNIPQKEFSALLVIFRTLVLAPVVESLGLVALILLLDWFGFSRWTRIFGASLALSALHSLVWPPSGFIVAPLFILSSYSFIRWREESFGAGLLSVFLIHFWHNIIPTTALLVKQFTLGNPTW